MDNRGDVIGLLLFISVAADELAELMARGGAGRYVLEGKLWLVWRDLRAAMEMYKELGGEVSGIGPDCC